MSESSGRSSVCSPSALRRARRRRSSRERPWGPPAPITRRRARPTAPGSRALRRGRRERRHPHPGKATAAPSAIAGARGVGQAPVDVAPIVSASITVGTTSGTSSVAWAKSRPCLPGTSLIGTPTDDHVEPRIRIKVGPIIAEFEGVADAVRDASSHSGTIRGSARDTRSSSMTRGEIRYRLHEDQDGAATRVDVEVGYTLTGPLAQFGRSAIVQEIAARMTETFARNLQARLDRGDSGTGAAQAAAARRARCGLAGLFGAVGPYQGRSSAPAAPLNSRSGRAWPRLTTSCCSTWMARSATRCWASGARSTTPFRRLATRRSNCRSSRCYVGPSAR